MDLRFLVWPIAVVALLVACDRAPQSPSPPPGPPPGPQVEPTVVSLSMEGPQVVPIGETVQYTLLARLSNGSSRDVTTEATWSALPATRVTVAGPGLVTGRDRGEAGIHAQFNDFYASKSAAVVPAGTLALFGKVREAGVPYGWLGSAQVDVAAGIGAGLSTFTNLSGDYRLYGVAGEITLRVTKTGYQPTDRVVNVADYQGGDAIVELPLAMPRVDLSGTYTLTITAAEACGTGLGEGHLPADGKVRTYAVVVRQEGPTLWATLGEGAGYFLGHVYPTQADFFMGWTEEGWPGFVERMSPTQFIGVIGGVAISSVTPNRVSGLLNGSILVSDPSTDWWPPIASCVSTRHQFVMSR